MIEDLEGYFKGLADRSRLRILNLLLYGELCGCDLQYVLEASQPNISRHLTYLKHVSLVADRREGFRVFYRLAEASDGIRKKLFDLLREAFRADPAFSEDLARLQRAVKAGACTMQQIRVFPKVSPVAAGATRPRSRAVAR
ncbi:MAG: metalloregulator ArsR/SmtB family transcription factor [Acidobacteria bacterium]|nr:metalloregulator ArsR/SmtB family transcription factor [Acidobacteriota bacterium]